MLYEMSHGFDITHELLVMDWHFKDILCLIIYSCIIIYMSNTFHMECVLYTYGGQNWTSIL